MKMLKIKEKKILLQLLLKNDSIVTIEKIINNNYRKKY